LGSYRHDLRFGYDFRGSDTDLYFSDIFVDEYRTEIHYLLTAYNASWRDRLGADGKLGTQLVEMELLWSPGRWTKYHRDGYFRSLRALSNAEYIIAKFNVQRDIPLPWDFELSMRWRSQVTTTNLLPSEQLNFGGYSTVRGYEESQARGDHGMVLNMELKLPSFSPTGLFTKQARDRLQVLGFWDYGWGNPDRRVVNGEDPNVFIQSAGVGARYSFNPWLSVRFDYGWQLEDVGKGSRFDSRAHLGVLVSF
jgi:hemolysin activation/secretion protein